MGGDDHLLPLKQPISTRAPADGPLPSRYGPPCHWHSVPRAVGCGRPPPEPRTGPPHPWAAVCGLFIGVRAAVCGWVDGWMGGLHSPSSWFRHRVIIGESFAQTLLPSLGSQSDLAPGLGLAILLDRPVRIRLAPVECPGQPSQAQSARPVCQSV